MCEEIIQQFNMHNNFARIVFRINTFDSELIFELHKISISSPMQSVLTLQSAS